MGEIVGATHLLRDNHAPGLDDEFSGFTGVERGEMGVDPNPITVWSWENDAYTS